MLRIMTWDNPDERLVIGSFCSLSDVTFLLGGNHDYRRLTTYPYWTHILGNEFMEKTGSKGPIIVEDDVWIGHDTMIMSGVTIGKGAVIGAGSIVTKDVPPYAVYVGDRVIKYRFSDEVIKKIINLDIAVIKDLSVDNQEKVLFTHLDDTNVDDIVSTMNIYRID